MTSSSTFSSCWTSLRARSSAMLDRSRSSSIAPLAPGEGGMQTASYYAHFPSLWQPARAWTSSLEFLRGYDNSNINLEKLFCDSASVLSLSRWETAGVAHGNDPFFPVYSMRKKTE